MGYQASVKVDKEVLALGVRARFLRITGVKNRERDPDFDRQWQRELRAQYTNLERDPNWRQTDPILAGYRQLHTAIGRSNRDHVSAPENLLRLLEKRGTLPHINALVDIYNLVSISTRLALGAHDLSLLDGPVRLRMTNGEEYFLPLGSEEPKAIYPGEYAYTDDVEVICRLETRQVDKSKVGLDTRDVLYIIQGNLETPAGYLDDTADRLAALTVKYAGGTARRLPIVTT